MSEFFHHVTQDTNFWVMLSTIICIGFIAFKAGKPLLSSLDDRALAIKARLDEAETLRLEAQGILEEYKLKSQNALAEAEQVLRGAERRAEQLRMHMEQDLKESIARQEANARSRIQRMEEEAVQSVKNILTNAALTQVREHAAETQILVPSIEHSLDDIKTILQSKQAN